MLRQAFSALAVATSIAGSTPLFAQVGHGGPGWDYKILHLPPPPTQDVYDSFRGGCVGQFSNDHHLDTVLLTFNEQIGMGVGHTFWGNGQYESVTAVEDPTAQLPLMTACGAVPGVVGGGKQDVIVTAHTDGLRVVWFDHVANAFTCKLLVGSPCDSADLVTCGNFGGGSAPDVLIHKRTGDDSVLWIVEDLQIMQMPGNWGLMHGAVRSIDVSGVLNDLVVLNFEGDDKDEIAVNTSLMGTCVLDASGGTVWGPAPYFRENDRLEALSLLNTNKHRLLIVGENGGGQYMITVHDPALSTQPTVVGALGVVDIGVGDWNDDGLEDVIVSSRVLWKLYIFFQEPELLQPFDLVNNLQIDLDGIVGPGEPASNNDASPIVADFDGDYDTDCLIGLDVLDAALMIHNTHNVRVDAVPDIDFSSTQDGMGPDDVVGAYDYSWIMGQGNSSHGEASFTLCAPVEWPRNIPTAWAESRVQIVVWRAADASSGADPVPVWRENFDWDENADPDDPWCVIDATTKTLHIPDHNLKKDEIFSCEVRLVKVDPGNRSDILDYGPSSFLILSGHTDQREILRIALGLSLADDVFKLVHTDINNPPPNGYGTDFGMEFIKAGCQAFGAPPDDPFD